MMQTALHGRIGMHFIEETVCTQSSIWQDDSRLPGGVESGPMLLNSYAQFSAVGLVETRMASAPAQETYHCHAGRVLQSVAVMRNAYAGANESILGSTAVQEFGLTPIMWQLADLARWLDPLIQVFTVIHNPKAAPNIEERGLIRALSQVSQRLIVMTW